MEQIKTTAPGCGENPAGSPETAGINEPWLSWAVELQGIAQAGLTYCGEDYDRERYERIRAITIEMLSHKTDISPEKVRELFCGETGYQTPKIDVRAAIFEDGKLLLVNEKNGTWALPGGWADVHLSVKENVLKEVMEEAGLTVTADRVIAVQDRERHNQPRYAYRVCKIFVLCSKTGGGFKENIETVGSAYFTLEDLPLLAEEKTNREQIAMCFDAYRSEGWKTLID